MRSPQRRLSRAARSTGNQTAFEGTVAACAPSLAVSVRAKRPHVSLLTLPPPHRSFHDYEGHA